LQAMKREAADADAAAEDRAASRAMRRVSDVDGGVCVVCACVCVWGGGGHMGVGPCGIFWRTPATSRAMRQVSVWAGGGGQAVIRGLVE
jgi:hypothetical protein